MGQIYTPEWVIQEMFHLLGGYFNTYQAFLHKHIVDNSCGDGRFLKNIIHLLKDWLSKQEKEIIRNYLECYIHGIELDESAYHTTISELNSTTQALFGINDIDWDIHNTDALTYHDFDGRMDIVIGNPPYVNIHNIDSELSQYSFMECGMSDLYLAFFELGFRMLRGNGRLCYITPSSWFTSVAGTPFRNYILEHRNLKRMIDFGHHQVFPDVTTYTAITLFERGPFNEIILQDEDERNGIRLSYDEININGKFYFADKKTLKDLKTILTETKQSKAYVVKNGYATLADKIFIDAPVKGPYTIDLVKAGTGEIHHCIYPYDANAKPIPEDDFKKNSIDEYIYLHSHKDELLNRDTDYDWFLFGRTQALKDTYKSKFAINSLLCKTCTPKVVEAPPGVGVYGGLYVLNLKNKDTKQLKSILESKEFKNYVIAMRKYKSGGYYMFTSKDLQKFLDFKS